MQGPTTPLHLPVAQMVESEYQDPISYCHECWAQGPALPDQVVQDLGI